MPELRGEHAAERDLAFRESPPPAVCHEQHAVGPEATAPHRQSDETAERPITEGTREALLEHPVGQVGRVSDVDDIAVERRCEGSRPGELRNPRDLLLVDPEGDRLW